MSWSELESQGYTVLRGFLSAQEMAPLLADFSRGRPPEDFPYGFKLIRPRVLKGLWPRLQQALDEVREQTSLKADMLNFLSVSHYITTRLASRSSILHQDFDMDFRLTGDHHHMLNFWIPIVKTEVSKSNLSLVPFDRLRERSEAAYEVMFGGGGCRFIPESGRTAVFANDGQIFEADTPAEPTLWLDFDVEELVVTPQLAAGDCLLLRGDLPHRTQDADSERVAASVRVTYSGKTVDRTKVGTPQEGDPAAPLLSRLLACFERLGEEQICLGQFLESGP